MINTINTIPDFRYYKLTKTALSQKTPEELALSLGKNVFFPQKTGQHTLFNTPLVYQLVAYREKALPALRNILKTSNDEKTIAETLFTIDRMIEANVQGIKKLYPELSRFNNTSSPNIQVLLAGIYRKTQIPDAFGPLMKMLVQNSINPKNNYPFDPTEEIGGAILDYLRAKGAVHFYSQNNSL